jgi:hypothetical protein
VKPLGAAVAKPQVFNPALVRTLCAAQIDVKTIKLALVLVMNNPTP